MPKFNKLNFETIYELIIPFYTYVLFAGIPLTLFKGLSQLQIIMVFCIASIALSAVQLLKIEKYKRIELGYGKASAMLLIVCGLYSMTHIETMVLMIIALAVFEVIGVYKKLNKISYVINLIIGVGIVFRVINNYNEIWQILSVMMVAALLLGVSRLIGRHNKYTVFYLTFSN